MYHGACHVLAFIGSEYSLPHPFSSVNTEIFPKTFAEKDVYPPKAETFETFKHYIEWNFDGPKEEIAVLMPGHRVSVNTTTYQHDRTAFQNKDDMLIIPKNLLCRRFSQPIALTVLPEKTSA